VRQLRFLTFELLIRGLCFVVLGTLALAYLYAGAVGLHGRDLARIFQALVEFFTGAETGSRPGFSPGALVRAAVATTLPLAYAAMAILALVAVVLASARAVSSSLARQYGRAEGRLAASLAWALLTLGASLPIFIGMWLLSLRYGSDAPYLLIAAVTVLNGGIGLDAARFLQKEMDRELRAAEGTISLPWSSGLAFPLPGSLSASAMSAVLPRFLPYLAGKVPIVIGGVMLSEILFSFPGLGSTLMDALLARDLETLVVSLFVLLSINAFVAFSIRLVLFLFYPRWYEKNA
jgi:hypothetical protein